MEMAGRLLTVGSHLGLPYYGTKSAPKMFPLTRHPVAATNGRILLTHREKHNDVRLWQWAVSDKRVERAQSTVHSSTAPPKRASD
jgi:hypothetical protein